MFFTQLFRWLIERTIEASTREGLWVAEMSSRFEKGWHSVTKFDMILSEDFINFCKQITVFVLLCWVHFRESIDRFAYPDQLHGFEMSGGALS